MVKLWKVFAPNVIKQTKQIKKKRNGKASKESKSEEAIVLLKESKDLIKAQQQEFRLKVQDLVKIILLYFKKTLPL